MPNFVNIFVVNDKICIFIPQKIITDGNSDKKFYSTSREI